MEQERIEYLFNRHYQKMATPSEKEELMVYISDGQYDAVITSLMYKLYTKEAVDDFSELNSTAKVAILQSIFANGKRPDMQHKIQSFNWKRLAIAASIVAMVSWTAYFWFHKNRSEPAVVQNATVQNDIRPGTSKAILTLADGSTIVLGDVANGSLAQQGSTHITKLDSGQISYQTASYDPITTANYNVLATPRGGQFSLILPDGSKVWLNAASSLKYPVAFNEKERIVELTGEGYFEVAKNATKPFKVKVGNSIVEAIGTAFNINAYPDEPSQNTTLVEGKVKVISVKNEVTLSPSQQAIIRDDHIISVDRLTEIDAFIGWKDGWFHFNDANIETVMRQLGRWYDVNIKYEADIPSLYNADLERSLPLSKLLSLLQRTQTIKFSIENDTVTVMSPD